MRRVWKFWVNVVAAFAPFFELPLTSLWPNPPLISPTIFHQILNINGQQEENTFYRMIQGILISTHNRYQTFNNQFEQKNQN